MRSIEERGDINAKLKLDWEQDNDKRRPIRGTSRAE